MKRQEKWMSLAVMQAVSILCMSLAMGELDATQKSPVGSFPPTHSTVNGKTVNSNMEVLDKILTVISTPAPLMKLSKWGPQVPSVQANKYLILNTKEESTALKVLGQNLLVETSQNQSAKEAAQPNAELEAPRKKEQQAVKNDLSQESLEHIEKLGVLNVNLRLITVETKLSDETSLKNLLLYILSNNMRNCVLTIFYDEFFERSTSLEALLMLSNPRQVVKLSDSRDFSDVIWEASKCRGYIFLLDQWDILTDVINSNDYAWDFDGRYVVIGLSREQLKAISLSKKIIKTENFLGIVKHPRVGEWALYTSQVIIGTGIKQLALWKVTRFTNVPSTLFPDKVSNLQGASLRVITFPYEPSVVYKLDKNGTVLDRYGRDVMVVRGLAEMLNATIIFNEVPNGYS